MLQPGFPSRLEGVWSKLRGHLARLSLVLAACRCIEGDVREERVEREDVEAASQLLGYFKAHARRVYAELSAPDSLEVLGVDLGELLDAEGGQIEATATELYRRLEEAGCDALPARPKELGQSIRALAGRSSTLRASFGWRGKEKVTRLELSENSVGSVGKDDISTNATNARTEGNDRPDAASTNATNARSGKDSLAASSAGSENAVGPVVTVDPAPGSDPGDNGTNGNNGVRARSEPQDRPDVVSGNPTDARPEGPGDGRKRFTL